MSRLMLIESPNCKHSARSPDLNQLIHDSSMDGLDNDTYLERQIHTVIGLCNADRLITPSRGAGEHTPSRDRQRVNFTAKRSVRPSCVGVPCE